MKNAVSGVGLAPDAAMVTFPINMFLPGSDIDPLEERRREFYDGLTGWKSEFAQAAGAAKMLEVEGATYEDALDKANNLLLTNLWGDGLPLWPATKERVDWILQGAALPRTHVLGKFPPRGGVTTDRDLRDRARDGGRAARVPAGARRRRGGVPRRRRLRPAAGDFGRAVPGRHRQRADREADPPELGLRLLGPDPQQPAGASIGRALRLLQQNVGGALPGVGTMAIFGAMRYTNAVFAEDEDGLPPGWQPHAHAAPRLRRRARTRCRSSSRAASPTSGAAAPRRKRRRRTC